MGKTRVIAETGAGQHGVACATAAALLGLECEIFMGKEDTDRQALNVYRMKLLGAKVHPVTSGTQTLKDAVNETMREWTNRVSDTHYVLGSVMGPHPFPTIVRDFQSVIGREAKAQILERKESFRQLFWRVSAAAAMQWVCSMSLFRKESCIDRLRGRRKRNRYG